MPTERPAPPPRPWRETEAEHATALEESLKAAVAYGRAKPGPEKEAALARASAARVALDLAVIALRRSERQHGREGAINWIRAQMGQQRHSSAVYSGTVSNDQWMKTLADALDALAKAVW